MGERRASMIERIVRGIEDCIEQWRAQEKARHAEAEASRDALWAEAAERERLLAEAMGEEEARRGTVEEVVKEQRVVFVMHSEEAARAWKPSRPKAIASYRRSPAVEGATRPPRG